MEQFDYWEESVAQSLEEHCVSATEEQIRLIAADMLCSHDNIRLAFGTPDSPHIAEIKKLERDLKIERSKVACEVCSGVGRLYSQGPYHSSDKQCWKCHGEGRIVL